MVWFTKFSRTLEIFKF